MKLSCYVRYVFDIIDVDTVHRYDYAIFWEIHSKFDLIIIFLAWPSNPDSIQDKSDKYIVFIYKQQQNDFNDRISIMHKLPESSSCCIGDIHGVVFFQINSWVSTVRPL